MSKEKFSKIIENLKNDSKNHSVSSNSFLRSAWETFEWEEGKISWRYFTYRTIFLIYFILCLSHSIYRDPDRHLWLIWATNISLLVQTIYATLFFAIISFRWLQNRREKAETKYLEDTTSLNGIDLGVAVGHEERDVTSLNRCESLTLVLLNLTGTFPYIITIAFWMFVDYDKKKTEGTTMGWYITDHGINALWAFVDTLVIAFPIRLSHMVYTLLTAVIYLSFSAVYEFVGGPYVYEDEKYIYVLLDWKSDGGWALVNSIIAIIFSAIFHLAMWLLFQVRIKLVAKFKLRAETKSISNLNTLDKEEDSQVTQKFLTHI